jgi:hypothetical protein
MPRICDTPCVMPVQHTRTTCVTPGATRLRHPCGTGCTHQRSSESWCLRKSRGILTPPNPQFSAQPRPVPGSSSAMAGAAASRPEWNTRPAEGGFGSDCTSGYWRLQSGWKTRSESKSGWSAVVADRIGWVFHYKGVNREKNRLHRPYSETTPPRTPTHMNQQFMQYKESPEGPCAMDPSHVWGPWAGGYNAHVGGGAPVGRCAAEGDCDG